MNKNKDQTPSNDVNAYLLEDGVTHINIYSKGRTELGKLLTHFKHMPFVHPYYGPFDSMEGFWHFMKSCQFKLPSHERDDNLRYMSGAYAKKYGKTKEMRRYSEFKEDIMAGNYQKIIQHEHLKRLFVESTLPFSHYYVYDNRGQPNTSFIIRPRGSDWLIEEFEKMRSEMKEGKIPEAWTQAELRYSRNVTDGN